MSITCERDAFGTALRWFAWATFLTVWSVALLTPQPAEWATETFPEETSRFLIAKSSHIGSYALLVILTCRLPVSRSVRWLLLAVLSLHGFGTEFFQQFVPGRNGCLEDVGYDHLGLG